VVDEVETGEEVKGGDDDDGDGDREKIGDDPVESCGVGGGVCAGVDIGTGSDGFIA
jgi:hypothetical protein